MLTPSDKAAPPPVAQTGSGALAASPSVAGFHPWEKHLTGMVGEGLLSKVMPSTQGHILPQVLPVPSTLGQATRQIESLQVPM